MAYLVGLVGEFVGFWCIITVGLGCGDLFGVSGFGFGSLVISGFVLGLVCGCSIGLVFLFVGFLEVGVGCGVCCVFRGCFSEFWVCGFVLCYCCFGLLFSGLLRFLCGFVDLVLVAGSVCC